MSYESAKILSPAKINLMLRVLSKRSDGYHQLQTCFQLLNWGDWMTFKLQSKSGQNQIKITGFRDLNLEDNIIYKAAKIIKPWAQSSSDWSINVDKQIPYGSGMGGGSSNAASTLKFLNEAWSCGLSENHLLKLAIKLGADVPVFILGRSCIAKGLGDELSVMEFETLHILLMLPKVSINTAELFSSSELNRSQSTVRVESIHNQAFWINDFFPVVLKKCHEIIGLYKLLRVYFDVRMSGTGSTMFALFNSKEEALEAQTEANRYCETIYTQPLVNGNYQ